MSRINGFASSDTTSHVTNASSQPGKVAGQRPVAQPILNGTVDAARLSAVSSAVAQATTGSDVRADKVAALQAAIAAGTYKVSAADVAEKVIGSLLGQR